MDSSFIGQTGGQIFHESAFPYQLQSQKLVVMLFGAQ